MLYGRLVFGKPGKPKGYVNIGDYIQTFAIDVIYEHLGIDKSQIVDIDRHDLSTYDGEEVVLPLNAWFGYTDDKLPLSEKIHPVFLGYHNMGDALPDMNKYGALGCRDEYTYNRLKKRGLDAYVSGCMTVLFPRREKQPEKEGIFIVDLPQSVINIIPENIRKKATYLSHEIKIVNDDGSEKTPAQLEQISADYIKRYEDEATLVITSRLHCAMLCLSKGINVIIARDSVDERFQFIDKFIKIYTPDNIDKVDWNGYAPDLEDFKKELLEYAGKTVSGIDDKEYRKKLHEFYMDRERVKIKHSFSVTAYEKLHKICPDLADFIREKILFKYTIAYNSRINSDDVK